MHLYVRDEPRVASAVRRRLLVAAGCTLLAVGCSSPQPASTAAALPDWSGAFSADADDPEPKFHTPGSVWRAVRDAMGWEGSEVSLTPKYQALRAAAFGKGKVPPAAHHHCLPSGMPSLMSHGTQFEFLFTPGRITMIFESGEVRRIYTDGRPHPDKSELYVDEQGHSIGRWEGSTLVVDTIGMHPNAELFLENGLKVTPNTHVLERFTRAADGAMVNETVVTDADVFAVPYRYMRRYPKVGDANFVVGCTRNNRDTEDQVDLTPPPEEG